jgi:SAM-dependent methyltransferase
VNVRFDPNAFSGTADYYLKYRFPYPEALILDLVSRTGIGADSRLLDLATGPGRLALALAPWFREVWAVDLEPEMIVAARAEAARRGIGHVCWSVGRAEELEAPAGHFDLVTVGEAFHRLDQAETARLCRRWLRPGGAFSSLGVYTILSARGPWQRIVTELVGKWTGRDASLTPAPKGACGIGPEHDEAVFREAGFGEVASHRFVVRQRWTADSIIGYLYSTSVCSRRVLGNRTQGFEDEVRAALLSHDPSGEYGEDMNFGYTFGRNPT